MSEDTVRGIAEEVARITAENARLLKRLAEGERRFRLISRGILKVQEAERARISRELHDGVGQSLTALKMQLELLEQASEKDAGPMLPRLAEIRELAERTLQEVRQLSHLIRPQMLDELGLVPTLRWLARTFEKRTGIAVELAAEGLDGWSDPEVETLVFRVAQEALTNVAKHAKAPSAEVLVRREAGRLLLRIRDDGEGFDASVAVAATADERGFGLRGMRDRVQLFGGRFSLESVPGSGTIVDVEVPLEGEGRG